IDARPMMTEAEFRAEVARADVVVAHAGCGTFLQCLELGKAPAMVPRRAAHDEHVDDHQEQLASVAAGRGLAVMREADELRWADLCEAAAIRVARTTDLRTACPPRPVPGAESPSPAAVPRIDSGRPVAASTEESKAWAAVSPFQLSEVRHRCAELRP